MRTTVPLFVELCAGTAALSLRLHARGARPPVSRMGAKTGYADCILRVLGLAPGTRAAHYLWCEPDPGVRLLLEAYRDADLARAAAAVIRGWADEEPRALWERLRAEGPPVLPATVDPREVARWVHMIGVGVLGKDPGAGFGGWARPFKVNGVVVSEIRQHGHPQVLAPALETIPTLPATIAPDARTVDPREVARCHLLGAWSYRKGEIESGFNAGYVAASVTTATHHGSNGRMPADEARMLDALPTLPATIAPNARDLHPPALPPGTIAYIDPPYVGTTGYASDLPRSEVVDLARRWNAAGAVVCISEAEAIPELVADGWHAVRIDGERVGQKRTFSRQQAEYLTLSHPPAWRPCLQQPLFQLR